MFLGGKKIHNSEKNHHAWTDEEIDYLKKNYCKETWENLLLHLDGWSKLSLLEKASSLGLRREVHFWSDEDLNNLRNYYASGLSGDEMFVRFCGRHSKAAIMTKAYKLGICADRIWSEPEIILLISTYPSMPLDDVVALFPDRNKDTVKVKAHSLGLKSYQYLNKMWTPEMDKFLHDN